MAKVKYFYNTNSLKYEKVTVSIGIKLWRVFRFLAATAVFASFILFLGYSYLDSPKEKQLKREISQLKLQYEILKDRMKQMDVVLGDLQDRDDNIYRVIFESNPIDEDIRKAGFGGVNRYRNLENYNYSELMVESTKKMDKLSKQLYIQSKSYDELIEEVKKKNELLASIPAIQPVANKKLKQMASGFGFRIHPIYKTSKMHQGMDFTAAIGTEIYATGDGVVINAGAERGYGNQVEISHGYGYMTRYAHMSKIKVRRGQKVKRGEVIGNVGSSGLSTGPHLHYEVHKNGKQINPINFYYNDLTPQEYEIMLEMSSKVNQSFD